MTDTLTPAQRRLNMSRIRGKNTKPELVLRRALHARGFRFRLHQRNLPGRPDIVLAKHRAALFVHGCFWHGHDCRLFRMPATRPEFWRAKIAANRRRDALAIEALRALDWRVGVIWECALRGAGRLSVEAMLGQLAGFISGATPQIEFRGGDDERGK